MIIIAILTMGALVIVGGVLLGLRTWVLDEAKLEQRLRAPQTHTVDFEVPNGWDPAPLKAALTHAHFTSLTRTGAGLEHLTIACEERDRARVRAVLENVHAAGATGPDECLGHVRFTDEV